MSPYCSHRRERNNRIAKLSDAENKNSFFLSDIGKRAFPFYKVPSLSSRSFRLRFKLFTVMFAIRNPHFQDYAFQILWFAPSAGR